MPLMSTPSLAARQQALLTALFASGHSSAEVTSEFIATHARATSARGFNAYQSNAHMLAERSLQSVYPVLAQLLGEESFAAFARAYWHAYPPQRGDLAQWGGDVHRFIAASPQLADVPYLEDMALLEWQLHEVTSALDAQTELQTLQHLIDHDPAELALHLAPGLAVLPSPWPVVSIFDAHQALVPANGADEEAATPDWSQVNQRLSEGQGETAIVWRQGFKPRVRVALAGEAAFLSAVQQSQSLEQALNSGLRVDFDFNAWLPLAVSTGLLLSVALYSADAIPDNLPSNTQGEPS